MGNETRTLWISVAAGVFATFLLYSYSQEKKAEWDKKFGATKRVVVATRNILDMETIDDTMLDIAEKPAEFIEPDAISDIESAIGQVAATPIKKGEQILPNKLLSPGPETGIALQVSLNKRAITIPIDEVRGVAKLIKPGDRVDIIAALDQGKGINQRREVSYLLYDIPVLATGRTVANAIPRLFEVDPNSKQVQQVNIANESFSTITIEVSPKEAQDIAYILSTSATNIFLTLRNPNDRSIPSNDSWAPTTADNIGRKGGLSAVSNLNNMPSSIPSLPSGPPTNSPPVQRPSIQAPTMMPRAPASPPQNGTKPGKFKSL